MSNNTLTQTKKTRTRSKPFPNLTGKTSNIRLGVIPSNCQPIVLKRNVLDRILEFSDSQSDVEIGGFLIGNLFQDRFLKSGYIEVSEFIEAEKVHNDYRSLTFTHDSWAHLHRQLDERFVDQMVVGWHHTHPGFGIFLSRQDEFIHQNFFSQPWQVALVVDPRQGELGFFQWNDQQQIVDTGFILID